MQTCPDPLEAGAILNDRFELRSVLGQGGFGITYLVTDIRRGDLAAVKELAPAGTRRLPDGAIDWSGLQPDHARRIRHQFLQEASLLRALRVRGILSIREVFRELATCYFVSEYLAGSESLEAKLRRCGPMEASDVRSCLLDLLGTLEELHARGILHRDIKPSNILVAENQTFLIDFGSAREWHADLTLLQTVQHTPGFAPIEQLSEHARRGPWTDLYALAATAYTLLTGNTPPSATDRLAGVEMPQIQARRPELDPLLCNAIEEALSLDAKDRPQSASAMRKLLTRGSASRAAGNRVDLIDEKLVALARLRFEKRECPQCGGVLDDPKPLGLSVCPCCREAKIQRRKVAVGMCPLCKAGVLRRTANEGPLAVCPICRTGRIRQHGLIPSKRKYICESCHATWSQSGAEVQQEGATYPVSWESLREISGRSPVVQLCDRCPAVFDELAGGRWRLVNESDLEYDELFPEEWAMVAAGLDPGAGNAVCSSCQAEYFWDNDAITLLGTHLDPFRFGERHQGERFTIERIRFAAVGKTSGNPGWACQECGLEFDRSGEFLTLVFSDRPALQDRIGEQYLFQDWHRLARDLPLTGQEAALEQDLESALLDAYVQGHLELDAKHPEVIWRGRSNLGPLLITEDWIQMGGLLRKQRLALSDLSSARAEEDNLILGLGDEDLEVRLEPVGWSIPLQSGRAHLSLGAAEVALRLSRLIRQGSG